MLPTRRWIAGIEAAFLIAGLLVVTNLASSAPAGAQVPGALWGQAVSSDIGRTAVTAGGDVLVQAGGCMPPASMPSSESFTSLGAQRWSSSGANQCPSGVTVDATGNSYYGVQTIDPNSTPSSVFTLVSRAPSGAVRWSVQTLGTIFTYGEDPIAFGADGRVYVTTWNGSSFFLEAFDARTGAAAPAPFPLTVPDPPDGLATYSGGIALAGLRSVTYYSYAGDVQQTFTSSPNIDLSFGNAAIGAGGSLFLAGYITANGVTDCELVVQKFTPAGEAWSWTDSTTTACNLIGLVATPDGGVVVGRLAESGSTGGANPTVYSSIAHTSSDAPGRARVRWSHIVDAPIANATRGVGGSEPVTTRPRVDANGNVAMGEGFLYDCPAFPSDTQRCAATKIDFVNQATGATTKPSISITDRTEHGFLPDPPLAVGPGRVYLSLGSWDGRPAGANHTLEAFDVPGMGVDYRSTLVPGYKAPLPPGARYVALGDSYSSGEGLSAWFVGTGAETSSSQGCHRSLNAYPSLIATELTGVTLSKQYEQQGGNTKFKFAACSGAVTADLTINGAGNQQFDSPKDAAQLSALGTNTKYVTLTVGGNDVRFANLIDGCLVAALATKHKNKPPTATVFNAKSFIAATGGDGTGALHQSPSECRQVIGVYEKHFVHGLRTKLVSLYREILKRAPIARLVVATYPRILRPSFQGVTVANVRLCAAVGQSISHARIGIYDENVSDLTSFQAALNDEISAAVKTVKANNPRRIALVDIYAKTTNNGITCGDKGITNYMSALRLAFSGKVVSTASFHPNKAGQKFMAQELRKALTK